MKLDMHMEQDDGSRAQEFKRYWPGYLAIIIAFILSIIVLVVSIWSSYGSKTATTAEPAVVVETEELPVIVMAAETEVSQNTAVEADAKADTAEEARATVWNFYNLDLQEDGKILNDYDFGPNPILDNISEEKVKEAIKGKKGSDTVKVEDLVEMMDAEALKKEQIRRMHDDPKLGAADMAWMDSILGTRFLGTFYSAAKEQWDVAMNDASDAWIADSETYNKALENFERKLDHANKVEVRYQKSGLKDQMYMEPNGLNPGVPDIVVMETTNHDGYFLVYTYVIKETKTLEVAYRIDCGYQPCNVAEIMKVKPKKNPNKKPTPTPTPTPTPVIPTPVPVIVNNSVVWVYPTNDSSKKHSTTTNKTDHHDPKPDKNPDPILPGPDPTPNPPKDPTQGTVVVPNDDPGPGENTNNPDNPDVSKDDKPTNSDHMSPDEYEKAIKDIESANQPGGGSEGGTPSTPSTPPPTSDTKVDNADGGNIDEPTKVHKGSQSGKKSGDHISAPD